MVYCTSLSAIRIKENGLTGGIPEGLFSIGLEEADFSRNELTGSIPPGSGKLFESLQVLDLSGNNLTGNISWTFLEVENLRYLNLSWNNFQSGLPPEVRYFQNLTVLDVRHSALVGSIPGNICDSGSLGILQLDGNSFTGFLMGLEIVHPSTYCKRPRVQSLETASGRNARSLSMLKKLKILKLEHNQLSGEIPQELVTIWEVKTGSMELQEAITKVSSIIDFSFIVAFSAAAVIALGVLIITLLNASVRRRIAFFENALESMCSSSSKSESLATGKLVLLDTKSSPDWTNSSLESVLNKAAEIGEGAFGTVYKAPLGGEGRIVAIKKLVTSKILQ
ncbi:hypothetical protein P3S67_032059 [Capsicum chacoense]